MLIWSGYILLIKNIRLLEAAIFHVWMNLMATSSQFEPSFNLSKVFQCSGTLPWNQCILIACVGLNMVLRWYYVVWLSSCCFSAEPLHDKMTAQMIARLTLRSLKCKTAKSLLCGVCLTDVIQQWPPLEQRFGLGTW